MEATIKMCRRTASEDVISWISDRTRSKQRWPVSQFTLEALQERRLLARGTNRLPQRCTAIDLEAAVQIVWTNPEHRPLMLQSGVKNVFQALS